jgi:hypothetical protein
VCPSTQNVGGGLVTGDQQELRDTGQFGSGQVIAVLADQHAQQVVAGVLEIAVDEVVHVLPHLRGNACAFFDTGACVQLYGGTVLKFVPVGLGHAQ